MPIPAGSTKVQSAGVALAPIISRSSYTTHTITAAAAVSVGSTSISLSAEAASVKIKAGQVLSFVAATPAGRQSVIILDNTTLSTTPATVNISPATQAIAASSTSPLVDSAIPLLGVQTLNMQTQDTKVDTTNLLSGIGTENAYVRASRMIQCAGIQIPGDYCLGTIVKPYIMNPAYYDKELYGQLVYASGEYYSGVVKLSNYQSSGSQNEVLRYSFDIEFMGITFTQIDAFVYP